MAINFLPREPLGPLGQQKRPWPPRTRLLRGPGSAGACGWWGGGVRGVHDAPGRGSGVAWGKPKQQPTCAAARSERGARRGRAGAPGQPGDGLGEREVHRACGLRASHSRGSGGGPSPRLPPLLHPAGETAGPTAASAATATGTVAAATQEEEEEEVSARGSRFLLLGWASAEGARGGRQRGCPDSVPGELRGGRGALSTLPPTTPCDCPRGTAGTDESHAGNSCCSAGPPRPPSRLCFSPSRRSILRQPARGLQPRTRGGSGAGIPGSVPAQGPGPPYAWDAGTRGPTRD